MPCSPAARRGGELADDLRLAKMGLSGVRVAGVHDDAGVQPGRTHPLRGGRDVPRGVVRPARAAAQDQVASGLPAVCTMRRAPPSIPRKRRGRRDDRGVHRELQVPSVPFLKPTGIDSPDAICRWSWLSVVRAPMAPQRPGRRCTGADRVQELGAAGRPSSLMRAGSGGPRAGRGNVVGAVQMRVVDEALPADRGARLLEVGAHDHRSSAVASRSLREPGRVVEAGLRVVDRAGPRPPEGADPRRRARHGSGGPGRRGTAAPPRGRAPRVPGRGWAAGRSRPRARRRWACAVRDQGAGWHRAFRWRRDGVHRISFVGNGCGGRRPAGSEYHPGAHGNGKGRTWCSGPCGSEGGYVRCALAAGTSRADTNTHTNGCSWPPQYAGCPRGPKPAVRAA